MNKRQLIILFAVAGLLGAALVAKRLAPRSEVYQEELQSLQIDFNQDAIDRVVITKGTEEAGVELQRTNGLWRIPSLWNAKADAEKIRRWLGSLSALQGEVRSEADDVLSDFGITDQQALHVALFQGGPPALHLLVGTKQAGWQQVFLRKANSSAVFLAQSPLLSEMGIYGEMENAKPAADVWVDLRIFSFSPETVQRIEIKEQDADWQELGGQLPFERDPAQLQAYLQSLLTLRAQRVVDPQGTAYGFDKPAWQLRLVRSEDAPIALAVGALPAEGGATDRYLRVEGAPEVFAVSSDVLEHIKVDGSRFVGHDPLKAGAATRDTLTVIAPGNERSVSIQRDRWAELDDYLQALKSFRVAKVQGLPDRAKADLATPYQIKLSGPQEALTIACEAPAAADAHEIVCINRQNAIPFAVDRSTFQALFERLERLERPAPALQETPAAGGRSEPSRNASPADGTHKDETKP